MEHRHASGRLSLIGQFSALVMEDLTDESTRNRLLAIEPVETAPVRVAMSDPAWESAAQAVRDGRLSLSKAAASLGVSRGRLTRAMAAQDTPARGARRAYSEAEIKAAVQTLARCSTANEAAQQTGVSARQLYEWARRYGVDTGGVAHG